LPFHAVFDADLYGEIRRAHSAPLRPRSVAGLADRIRTLANQRLDLLLPRGSFDLTQEYGGIVAASMVCGLLGLPEDLAPQVLAAVNAGSLAEPGVGVDTAEARPNYLGFLTPVVERRRAGSSGDALPVVDGLLGYRLPDGSALNDVEAATQMLCIFIGGTETVPKIVAHGLWELGQRPEQMAAVRADPAATVPIAREEMLRYCAPAQWFARTARKPFTIHGETIEPGQRIITLLASANRDEREYPDPDEFIWDRPIKRSLVFGRGQHFCIGYHLARLEVAVLVQEWLRRVPDFEIRGEDATRLPSSFQWGWNNIPVEV
jgi:cytochrome P450